MDLVIKIAVLLISGAFFSYGGYKDHNFRRFYLPHILTLSCWWLTKDLWALTMLSVIGIYCSGYGDKSILRHIFGDGWGRGIWGLLGAITLSLWAILTGHIVWYLFAGYLLLNFTLENALKSVYQLAGDFIIGMGFGVIVFLVH